MYKRHKSVLQRLAVDCEELLITLPGYSVPVLIKVDKDLTCV